LSERSDSPASTSAFPPHRRSPDRRQVAGLRQNECSSLTPDSFDLADLSAATVVVEAAYSKHHRRGCQPIRRSLAEAMAEYLKDRPPGERLWLLPSKPIDMFRRDIEAAGIAYVDRQGKFADFHNLRHTFVTRLVRAGVAPAVAQKLVRHSTMTLTMDYSTHISLYDERAALVALPSDEGDR